MLNDNMLYNSLSSKDWSDLEFLCWEQVHTYLTMHGITYSWADCIIFGQRFSWDARFSMAQVFTLNSPSSFALSGLSQALHRRFDHDQVKS